MSGTLHVDLEGMTVNNIEDDTLDADKKMIHLWKAAMMYGKFI